MMQHNATNRRVIVIDDNVAIHDDFRKILAGCEAASELDDDERFLFSEPSRTEENVADTYEVDTASQGQQGLDMVREAVEEGRPYAVAFVDMRMPPGWDGVETIEHLWGADPELLVVVCTAYSDYSWQEMITRLGQSDQLLILRKPFDVVEVVQIAAALTRKWDTRREVTQTLTQMSVKLEQRDRDAAANKELTTRLLNVIPCVLVELDEDARVTRWNNRAADVLGPCRDEALGQPFGELAIEWQNPLTAGRLIQNEHDENAASVRATVLDRRGQPRQLSFSGLDAPDSRFVLLGAEVAASDPAEATAGSFGNGEIDERLRTVAENLERFQSTCDSAMAALRACRRLLNSDAAPPFSLTDDDSDGMASGLDQVIEAIPRALRESITSFDQLRHSLRETTACS